MDFVPLQLPEAVHEVALVEDHVKVELPPEDMDVGDADIVTVGGGVETVPTVTVIGEEVVERPPLSVALAVKV